MKYSISSSLVRFLHLIKGTTLREIGAFSFIGVF